MGNKLTPEHRKALSEASQKRWARWRARHPEAGKKRTKIEVFLEDVEALERLAESKAVALHSLVQAATLLDWKWDGEKRVYVGTLKAT